MNITLPYEFGTELLFVGLDTDIGMWRMIRSSEWYCTIGKEDDEIRIDIELPNADSFRVISTYTTDQLDEATAELEYFNFVEKQICVAPKRTCKYSNKLGSITDEEI